MRFHLPSFLHYWEHVCPYDVPYWHYNFMLYLYPGEPKSSKMLQRLVIDALVKSVDAPIGTRTTTEQASLFDTCMESHLDALKSTLQDTDTYIKKVPHPPQNGGKVRYDYKIDLTVIRSTLQAVRLEEDVKLALDAIRGNYYISLRALQGMIRTRTGYVLSLKRLSPVLNTLEKQGVLKRGKNVNIVGREVVSRKKGKLLALFGG